MGLPENEPPSRASCSPSKHRTMITSNQTHATAWLLPRVVTSRDNAWWWTTAEGGFEEPGSVDITPSHNSRRRATVCEQRNMRSHEWKGAKIPPQQAPWVPRINPARGAPAAALLEVDR
jgi:hypothetical protein